MLKKTERVLKDWPLQQWSQENVDIKKKINSLLESRTMKIAAPLLIGVMAFVPWAVVNQTQSDSDEKPVDACVTPSKGPIGIPTATAVGMSKTTLETPFARVGHAAPDFEAGAYVDGGFKPLQLSSFKGKWVVLCFYPGDFTFV